MQELLQFCWQKFSALKTKRLFENNHCLELGSWNEQAKALTQPTILEHLDSVSNSAVI